MNIESYGEKASLNELLAYYDFLKNGKEESRRLWILERLKRERQKYEERGIPPEQWPSKFMGEESEATWEVQMREKLNLPIPEHLLMLGGKRGGPVKQDAIDISWEDEDESIEEEALIKSNDNNDGGGNDC